MQDPRTKYATPPFDKQPQPVPGLAQDMSPKPDHGEKSYRGSRRLEGRRALITGADSGIGRAVAIAFAQPAELAGVYVLLASEESSYITGEIYGVTGGNPLP